MAYPHIQYRGAPYPDPLESETSATTRELDSRMSDGISVRLLWHSVDSSVSVAVHDTKTGETLEVPVGDGDRALDVFHHPYAYAAGRGHVAGGSFPVSADTALAA
ncbi:MAG TPA: hypothetical protein VLW51_06195 [Solirubrobacteraceae bacterium]|nr:hypothetical protein [Solirubrobacteraceae bacterium]